MARILIVGCGCRGLALARSLTAAGHVTRGTTRNAARLGEIEAAGVEPAIADPDRLASLAAVIDGVSVACWLMGSATGDARAVAALHRPRLASALELVVDTHVRGFVYEAGGTVASVLREAGAEIARHAASTYRMPVEVVTIDPSDQGAWVAAMTDAVERTLSA